MPELLDTIRREIESRLGSCDRPREKRPTCKARSTHWTGSVRRPRPAVAADGGSPAQTGQAQHPAGDPTTGDW